MNRLRTAVLGLGCNGQLLLEAASQINHFQVQAVADKDCELAEKAAGRYQCTAYDDYRQVIMQNQLDCLLVAAPMYSCDEYIKMAMKKKVNVLKLPPAARGFEEALEFVRLAESEGIKFAIGNINRFAQSFLDLRRFLQQGNLEQVFLINAFCFVDNQDIDSWQCDQKLAGGGVLLHNCYDIIDQIVYNFTTPQQVYSLNTNTASDKQQKHYLTEDTVVVTMKFTESFFANLVASQHAGIESRQKFVKISGKDKTLTVSDTRFTVKNRDGQIIEDLEYNNDRLCPMGKLLENFALSILLPEENKLYSSGSENLNNMAVIESAYLSARTGFAEEPARIVEMVSQHMPMPTNTRPAHE